jgi:hypothetical protein
MLPTLRRTAAVAALAGVLALGVPASAQARPGRDTDRFDRAGRLTLVIRVFHSLFNLWQKDGAAPTGGGNH